MLEKTAGRRSRLGARVDFPDRHCNYVVTTILFCVLNGDLPLWAIAERKRIQKPDGRTRLLECIYSEGPLKHLVVR